MALLQGNLLNFLRSFLGHFSWVLVSLSFQHVSCSFHRFNKDAFHQRCCCPHHCWRCEGYWPGIDHWAPLISSHQLALKLWMVILGAQQSGQFSTHFYPTPQIHNSPEDRGWLVFPTLSSLGPAAWFFLMMGMIFAFSSHWGLPLIDKTFPKWYRATSQRHWPPPSGSPSSPINLYMPHLLKDP